MVKHYIPPHEQNELQYNLIRSHACGVEGHLSPQFVRAILLARLNSLLQGYSGVSSEILAGIEVMIESDIIPRVPRHGSVGASGDLIQLAHIALSLIGEGEVVVNGRYQSTKSYLKKRKINPVTLKGRDGLALINGTSAMTGIAALVLAEGKLLLSNSIKLSALLYELFSVNSEHINPIVGESRPHPGQKYIADELRLILKDSQNVLKYSGVTKNQTTGEAVSKSLQEIYSLRCIPQILGPIHDTIFNAINVVEVELNSATDNPLFDENEGIIHSGNFHGDYVSHEMDKVRIALTKLSILHERQLNLLVNPAVNHILPPYVNRNRPGLNLALQAVQFIATSTTAENQTLATPIVIHSIPTNNDNQDIVSMGCNSALLTDKVLQNTFQVQAALSLTIIEALDIKKVKLTTPLKEFYHTLRSEVSPISKDRPLTKDLERIVTVLKN
jgi:histidine ammonia-lyase